MSLKSGHKIVPVTGKTKELCELFTGRSETVLLQPGNWTFFKAIAKFGDKYYDFKFEKDDVVVNTMPKSGTTWCQEIVWTLRHNVNLDNPAGKMPLPARSPNLDADFVVEHMEKPKALVKYVTDSCPGYDTSEGVFLKAAEIAPRPRTIKCHALSLLHPNLLNTVKIVYVIRDPRDVCMSYYHHCRVFTYENFTGTLDQFVDAFIEGGVTWGPYWSHVNLAWEKRDHPNMFITFYEQLKKNPKVEYRRLADFLDVKATDEQLEKIIHFTSFAEMRKRDDHVITLEDSVDFMKADIMAKDGGFFRKGTTGNWKDDLSKEQEEKFESWIKNNCSDKEIMKNIRGD